MMLLSFLFPLFAHAAEPTAIAWNRDEGAKLAAVAAPYLADGNPRHTLEVLRPWPTISKAPLVIFVHGGAWVGGSREAYRPLGEALVREGWAVALIEYRLAGEAPHPGPLQDCAAATGWLLDRVEALGVDPGKVFWLGHSAGGHIVASLGLDRRYFPAERAATIQGVIGVEGIYDLTALGHRFPGYVDWFLNLASGANQSKWADASPIHRAGKSPSRWYLVHSDADELVDPGQSDAMGKSLVAAGTRALVHRLHGLDHFAVVDLSRPSAPLLAVLRKFIHAP